MNEEEFKMFQYRLSESTSGEDPEMKERFSINGLLASDSGHQYYWHLKGRIMKEAMEKFIDEFCEPVDESNLDKKSDK